MPREFSRGKGVGGEHGQIATPFGQTWFRSRNSRKWMRENPVRMGHRAAKFREKNDELWCDSDTIVI